MLIVDLNADVGESFGAYTVGDDAALFRVVSSVSVAAGFHGGDPSVLRATIQLARAHGVAVGAHPGFPDLAGFGRREMHLSPGELHDIVLYQVAAVAGVAAADGVRLQHVKPHGALYNMAARDPVLATAVVRAITAADRGLLVFAPPASALAAAAAAAGLRTFREGFADRAYRSDGSLSPRELPGSVLLNAEHVVTRAVRLVSTGKVAATDGTDIDVPVDTLCLHGDTPGAGELAARLREGLERSGIAVIAPQRSGRG